MDTFPLSEGLHLISIPILYTVYRYQGSPEFFIKHSRLAVADNQATSIYYNRFAGLFLLGVVPLVLLLLAGKNPLEYGLGETRMLPFLWTTIAGSFIGVGIVYSQVRSPSIRAYYPLILSLRRPGGPVISSAISECLFLCGFEFFWRGYVLFSLRNDLGLAPGYAVLMANVMCTLIHMGKPEREVLSVLTLNFWFGWLSFYTGSIGAVVLQRCVGAVSLEGLVAREHLRQASVLAHDSTTAS